MLTTGMLMFGKMSVGVRKMDSVPRIKIRIASTTNVYGRFSATLTIHIIHPFGLADCTIQIDLMSYASGSWRSKSRSVARPLGAQQLFRIEQFPAQESPCHIHGGCRHCLDGLWNPRGKLLRTIHAPWSSSRFRNEELRPFRPMNRGRPGQRQRKRRLPA